MVLWIGVDDTDSLRGMCTTFLATELVRELTKAYDLIGYPRLVRLNPNIPWKTRGNGAICLRIGRGRGPAWKLGEVAGREILAYPRGDSGGTPSSIRGTVAQLVETWSQFDDPSTNPGFAILRRPPPAGFYWKAVRTVVTKREALGLVRGYGIVSGYKSGRGVIGAIAALSWRPRDRTYEVLAYRHPSRLGTSRRIDEESVIDMDRRFPTTFSNYDYDNRRVVITPRSPCPILMGIRGDDPAVLPEALRCVRGEGPDRWIVFETNQGTDDHIAPDDWRLRPATASALTGTVVSTPYTMPGGHVLFTLEGRRRLVVATYEPSKGFRDVVRSLVPGDLVRVYGSVRHTPRGLNLEKLHVLRLATVRIKHANPRCPECGKRMKSVGHDAPFRCLRGHATFAREAAEYVIAARSLKEGFYEPPASSRRHLAKPLKRLGREKGVPFMRVGTSAHGTEVRSARERESFRSSPKPNIREACEPAAG